MRILMVSPSVFLSDSVAQSVHQREFVKNLRDAGHEVDIICRMREGAKKRRGVFPVYSNDIPLARPFFTRSSYKKACDLLSRQKYDIVHDRGYLGGGSGTKAANKYNVPAIIQIDDNWVESEKLTFKPLNWFGMEKRARSWCGDYISSAGGAFTVTQALLDDIGLNWCVNPARVGVVPNGVDPELFTPKADPSGVITKYGLSKKKVVVFVGALGPWHGVENLIRSAKNIQKEIPELVVLVVGGFKAVSRKDELQRLTIELGLEKTVLFTGQVPYEDVPKYINAGHVATAPYPKLELGFSPLKLFEYWACQKPVICSDLPWTREVVTSGTGLLVPPGNLEALSEAIIKALLDEKLADSIGRKARKLALSEYTWKRSTEKLLSLYGNVLEKWP